MKTLIGLGLFLVSLSSPASIIFNKECSLEKKMMPYCYHKRDLPVVYTSLMYYGSSMSEDHLNKISELLKQRFSESTQNKLEVNIVHQTVLPLLQPLPDDFTYNGITDKDRLHRIWYYENVGGKVLNEAYEVYKDKYPEILKNIDVLLIITEAQFNALGLASGRVSATEYPQEIAWATEGGGRTNLPSNYRLVDELVHEIGHNLFIGHAATQCQNPKLTKEEKKKCIKDSPNSNDVMSYNRNRSGVSDSYMNVFEQCNINNIEQGIIPELLKGGKWNFDNRKRCN